KCLEEIERRYNHSDKKRLKASSLKKSFKTGYSACYPGFPWRVSICSAILSNVVIQTYKLSELAQLDLRLNKSTRVKASNSIDIK
ncbi:14641_t:CDS:2, partial [Racocetra persica]